MTGLGQTWDKKQCLANCHQISKGCPVRT